MQTGDALVEIETLEKALLPPENDLADNNGGNLGIDDDRETPILYTASFLDMEEDFLKYYTSKWLLYSLLLVLAWGIGFFMLLYLPVRRFVLRRDIRSRMLYLTPNAIVYKVTKPASFPCFGVLKKEKYVLLPSVADIVIEQGYLQSFFDIYSVRIENVGVRRPPSDDLQIQGVANPNAFRKAVLTQLANMKAEAFPRQSSLTEDASTRTAYPQTSEIYHSQSFRQDALPPSERGLLQKLEEVDSSIKRVQTLIEKQQSQGFPSDGRMEGLS
ncbi:uncharacterized protein LOC141592495 isoform X2 [Silene latifolia]|uniref:uncharacterized protein LOC141592495 isoform X2 n=1 Tax=Silene latifolia TaxID=37657 RepID=UPI003D77EF3E